MTKFLLALDEIFPLRLFLFAAAALLFLWVAAPFAFAADTASSNVGQTFLDTIISYGLPLIETLAAFAVTWIIGQIIQLLGITDQATRLQVEGQLRDALHFAAENGLKYAFAKLGVAPSLAASASIIADAIAYVKDKNPDTVAAFGLDDQALEHIILSKLPSVVSSSAAASLFSGGFTSTVEPAVLSTTDPAPAAAAPSVG